MPSERVQRRIDRLLDDAEQAMDQHDWALALAQAQAVLELDPDNSDAASFLAACGRSRIPWPHHLHERRRVQQFARHRPQTRGRR